MLQTFLLDQENVQKTLTTLLKIQSNLNIKRIDFQQFSLNTPKHGSTLVSYLLRTGRELLILNKKEFNNLNLNTIIVWVYESGSW